MKIITTENASATQTEHPTRASLRTFIQALIPAAGLFILAVPEIVRIVLDETDRHGVAIPPQLYAWLTGLSVACALAAAIIARVMAVPGVERALRQTGLSAAPSEAEVPGRWAGADDETADGAVEQPGDFENPVIEMPDEAAITPLPAYEPEH